MLDAGTKSQLKSYLDRITQPVEIVASLDDSEASGELQSLLKDVAESSPLVKITQSRDDNNRKPICRLRFNNEAKLVVGLFNESKEEERIAISTIDQLFHFSDRLTSSVNGYLDVTTDKSGAPLTA